MKASARVFVIIIWLGALILAGSILLELTAARVGEHKSSTYGFAYFQFQEGWGGEIGIIPPEFTLQRNYKFNAFHYPFLAVIDGFYFLFVAYLIRFFGILPTFGISIALTAAMFFLYCPNVFGRWFAFRVAGVYLFLLTVVFSLIFIMPIFRGLLFVVLIFLIFMSLMVFISRSDISKWPILQSAT